MQLISFRGGIATEAWSISLPTNNKKLITTDEHAKALVANVCSEGGTEHR